MEIQRFVTPNGTEVVIRADYQPPEKLSWLTFGGPKPGSPGRYRIMGQDMGPEVKKQFGSTDYEYFISVHEDDMPRLWPHLMKDRFSSAEPLTFSKLQKLCEEAEIDPHFFCWP